MLSLSRRKSRNAALALPSPLHPVGRRAWLRAALGGAAAATLFPRAWPVQAAPGVPAKGDTIAWPALQLLDGHRLPPDFWADRAAVVVFFSLDCPYCRRHNARLERLHRQLRAQPPGAGAALSVLGVATDGSLAAVQQHQQALGYSFPITQDEPALRPLLRSRRMVPLTCVIDRQQVLREIIPGEMSEADVLGLARWAQRSLQM